MNSYIEIAGLTKSYGRIRALEDVQLSLGRGSVLALLGPNGAGKSTLFGCLLGLSFPDRGRILVDARELNPAARAGFGYLAERVSLYSQRTVFDNAAFFGRLKGHSAEEILQQLERVGLDHARDRKVHQLSKGMLQRLGLAIALCGQPELLVLDEPFTGLDPSLLETLQSILLEENHRGATLLISTHTISAVEPLATHVAILLQGRLAAFGSLEDFRSDYPDSSSLESIYHDVAREHTQPQEVFA
jgi:ABC-type multidrug transport system ATPase subunit